MKKRKLFSILFGTFACILGVTFGFMVGNNITSSRFTTNKYAGVTAAELYDNIDNISIEGKLPTDFSPEIVYQIAHKKIRETHN